jgi:hypothetical protein
VGGRIDQISRGRELAAQWVLVEFALRVHRRPSSRLPGAAIPETRTP